MVKRLFKHMFFPPLLLKKHFTRPLIEEIETAIRDSETWHSGEIRFVVETALPFSALWKRKTARQAAVDVFGHLRVWDTEQNSGVLIYLLFADHDLEIVADRGIAAKVEQAEWDDIARHMELHYRAGDFRKGTLEGISRVTELLARHFPPGERNPNELSDKPVILEK